MTIDTTTSSIPVPGGVTDGAPAVPLPGGVIDPGPAPTPPVPPPVPGEERAPDPAVLHPTPTTRPVPHEEREPDPPTIQHPQTPPTTAGSTVGPATVQVRCEYPAGMIDTPGCESPEQAETHLPGAAGEASVAVPTGPPTLPVTGSPTAGVALVGAMALSAGVLMVRRARKMAVR